MTLLVIWGAGFVGYLIGWMFHGGTSAQQLQEAAMQGYLAGYKIRGELEAAKPEPEEQPRFRSIEQQAIDHLLENL